MVKMWFIIFGLASGERAIAALVISGHKASSSDFVQQSACAASTLFASARAAGGFAGPTVVMTGPLVPVEPQSWSSMNWNHHDDLVKRLAGLLLEARVWDLVPMLNSDRYPFMKRNLNFMKLAVYELPYDEVMFIDLDVVVIAPLAPIFDLINGTDIVGYRTCTTPLNSGFFVVRGSVQRLRDLDGIVRRNKCPCKHDVQPFADHGYDRFGSLRGELQRLWHGSKLCANMLAKTSHTWEFAGAGTGQGLMFYYYGVLRRAYHSLVYSQLPIVHYNAPGPKPWSSATPTNLCDAVWWWAFADAHNTSATVRSYCSARFKPIFDQDKRRQLQPPMCCRSCPGGGHFATPHECSETAHLKPYVRTACKVVSQIDGAPSFTPM